jgi:DNA-directed RNA polymerase subunit beta
LLKNEFKKIIFDIEKRIKKKVNENRKKIIKHHDPKKLITSSTVNSHLRKFFNTNPLSQLLDEINSLAEITHKRKLSSFGVGALDKKKANLNVREIHPSQFGRLCPIETAEGKNAGLVLSLAKDVELDKYGFIASPLYV